MKKTIILLVFMVALVITSFNPKCISYAEISNPFVEVVFNSNGGTFVASQFIRVGEKIERPDAPVDRIATDIFAGWYYLDNGEEKIWNFEDVVSHNITLYAKWTNLECLDYSVLSQTLEDLKPVNFYIETTEDVVWFVNGERQYGVIGNRFTFYTPENGSYMISCRVAGVESKKFLVAIDYYVPEELNVKMEVSAGNLYTFEIENGEFMNSENCTWYCMVGDETAKSIGTGIKCTQRLSKNCKVFVVYENDKNGSQIFSRNLIIEPEFNIPTTLYILLGVGAGVVALIVVFVVISRKKYKDYY